MGLETFGYISDLVATNPVGASDQKAQGDDHIRGIKSTLLASFPNIGGAVTLTHTQINDAARKSAANIFTAAQTVSGTVPAFILKEADAAADNQLWYFLANTGSFAFYAVNDAASVFSPVLLGTRSGTTITFAQLNGTEIELNGTTLDFNGAMDLSGRATFHETTPSGLLSTIVLQSSAPGIAFYETDASTNEGRWLIYASGDVLRFRSYNDAGSAQEEWLNVNRTAEAVTSIQFNGDKFDLNGLLDVDGSGVHAITGTRLDIDVGTNSDVRLIDTAIPKLSLYVGGTQRAYMQYSEAGSAVLIDSDAKFELNTNNAQVLSVATSGAITTPGASAAEFGFHGVPALSHSAASSYPFVLADRDKHVRLTGSATGATIPANASVAFPVGTCLGIVNDTGGNVTIAITTDTLEWALGGGTGSRTLADNGIAVAIKIASTTWKIAGAGLS